MVLDGAEQMELNAEERFIESLGLFLEGMGFPRIAGRILGLLFFEGRPMPLDEIAAALKVSRASVSTNTRLLIQVALIEERSRPGDRRSWFQVRPDAFRQRIRFMVAQFEALTGLFEQGVAALPPEREVARRTMGEAIRFHRALSAELAGLSAKWEREIQENRQEERTT